MSQSGDSVSASVIRGVVGGYLRVHPPGARRDRPARGANRDVRSLLHPLNLFNRDSIHDRAARGPPTI